MTTLESLRAESRRIRAETEQIRAETVRIRAENEEMKQQRHRIRMKFDETLNVWDAMVATQRAAEAYFALRAFLLALLDAEGYK